MKRIFLTFWMIYKVVLSQTFEPDPPSFSIEVTNISAIIEQPYTVRKKKHFHLVKNELKMSCFLLVSCE